MYGSELEDDEDDLEEELRTEAESGSSDASTKIVTPIDDKSRPPQPVAEKLEPTAEN
jgi:hypothetical protein